MSMITLRINGSDYSHDASPAEFAGLGASRARVMGQLSPGEGQDADTPLAERPGYIASDTAWLTGVIQEWADRENADGPAIQACIARALHSWSGAPASEAPSPEPLSSEAETARRIAGIKAEAQRRIIALTGARDIQSCVIKQLNALMRAMELSRKEAQGWTAEEATEAARLQALADGVKAIRARSDLIERDPPEDFTAERHWTA